MPNTRYEPRSYAVEPSGFGKFFGIEWLPDPEDRQDRINMEAAIVQHQWALRVNRSLAHKGVSVPEYAAAIGQSPHRVGQVLRGAVIMRLTDIAAAQLTLGLSGWRPIIKTAGADHRPDLQADTARR